MNQRQKKKIKQKLLTALLLVTFSIQPILIPIALASGTVAVPDKSQGKNPNVSQSANGTTVIDIRTPNQNGLSHNQYKDLQVGSGGIIFNNSAMNVNTKLAGYINANQYLKGTKANLILNEITGNLPTNLNGYMEIAGNKAGLILANPNGIVGGNFGFINTQRAVLTTGIPQIQNGQLNGFIVNRGTIEINGKGMDARGTERTDIIAEAVKINAGIWANDLRVVTGNNQVGYQDQSVKAITTKDKGVSLDVAALGGMYAGRIELIGTAKGVGVNSAGNISAQNGGLHLDQNGSITLGGNTYAEKEINITTGAGFTQAGQMYGEGNIEIKAQSGIAQKGQMSAEQDIALTAAQGDISQQGTLYAKGSLALTAANGSIVNAGHTAKAEKELRLDAKKTINNNGGALTGAQAALKATDLINNAGSIKSTGNGGLSIEANTIANENAIIQSGGALTLKTGEMNNKAGQLYGEKRLKINAGGLSGDGKILSNEDITLYLSRGFQNTGQLQAANDITLTSQGEIINQNQLIAGNKINIEAAGLTNQGAGKIAAAATQISVNGALNNTALINGEDTFIKANTVTNSGVGRIYGDHIAIEANTLNNIGISASAPVIAARKQMDLGVGAITNKEHAQITSQGDIAIGGQLDENHQAIGAAQTIENSSATIEAGNDLAISAKNIHNTNAHFQTAVETVGTQWIEEYQGSGQVKRYQKGLWGDIPYIPEGWTRPDLAVYIFDEEVDHLHTPEGDFEEFIRYAYKRTIKEDVIKQTDPGKIIAGRNITLNAGNIVNDKSQIIAGAALTGTVQNIRNIDFKATRTYIDEGDVTNYWREKHRGEDSTASNTVQYAPASTRQTIDAGAVKSADNTQAPLDAAKADAYTPQAVQTTDVADGTVIHSGINPHIAGSSLYLISKNPAAASYIETDPDYINYRNWISSDYFFNKMQSDPDKIQKRLGDGYYEQQLVKDQILKLTGNRFVGDYVSDEEQYLALMDNAIAFAQTSGAKIGQELSKEQIGGLKESIVWMVEKTVVLPDGQIVKALIPEVYIKQTNGQQSGQNSALISAKDISLGNAETIINQGIIKAQETAVIKGQNITNDGGKINAKKLGIEAEQNITNSGGSLSAQDILSLKAGRDINITSTAATEQNSQGHTTNINALGTVQLTGENGILDISAGNDINLKAALIENEGQGQTNLTAKNNINIETVTVSESHDIKWDDSNKRHDESSQEIGSLISGKGEINLTAQNTINIKGAAMQSESEINLNAQKDINITAARASASVTEDHKHKGKTGGGNSQTTITHDELSQNIAQGSSLSADEINIKAGQNVKIKGGDIIADQTIKIDAGKNISLQNETSSQAQLHTKQEKSKGLLSAKQTDIYDQNAIEAIDKATISGATVEMNAGKNINVTGSNVVADQDITIKAGENINITAQEQTSGSTYKKQEKKSGILSGGGLGFTIGKQEQKDNYENQSKEQIGSTIGSLGGNINLEAGKDVNIKASDVLAGKDINISGENVTIQSADNVYNNKETHEFKKTGLTVSLGGGTIDAAEKVIQPITRAGQVKDDRLEALYAYKAGKELEENKEKLQQAGKGNLGLSLNVSLGTSKSESKAQSTTTLAQGSNISANGDINITATKGDITVKGSTVEAENIKLKAEENINLLASENKNKTEEDTKSSGASLGISIDLTTGGLGINAGINKGKGQIKENGTTYTGSQINANDKLQIETGKDLDIIGSKVSGNKVEIQVGENLNIESLQDKQTYDEKNSSTGININPHIVLENCTFPVIPAHS